VRFAYLKERLGRLWHPVKGVTILSAPEGRFLFQFNHKKDAENALEDGPWVYDNSNLVLERINPGMVPRDVELNHLDMWVQVHNLPFGFVQQRVGTAIGAYLGELKEYDEKNSLHSAYMRLKVRIDITKPLKQEWKVRAGGGD
jgi:hypothetical protein